MKSGLICTRLDRATSGCLVLTKNHLILKDLHKIWNSDSVKKVYTTLVSGTVPKDLTAIKTNLKVERHNKIRKSIRSNQDAGKVSETEIISNRPISNSYSLLKLSLKSEECGQIRRSFRI